MVPLLYFVVSAVYIVFSDWFLLKIIPDIDIYREVQTFKGWIFITISAILIYFLIKNLIEKIEDELSMEADLQLKLRTNEANYYELFNNNPIPMWFYDLNSYKFLEVNQAALSHYGYTREEFLNMTIMDIRPKEDISILKEDVINNSSQLSKPKVWRHLKKNGEMIFVEIKSHSFSFKGIDARNVMVHDVTETIKLNQDLSVAKQKAEESDKLKSALLQNISHEIRTPLNGILGLSSLLLDNDIDSNEKIEFSDLIKKSSNRLIITIENLIELSKIQCGDTKVDKSITHINTILNELYDSYYNQCNYQQIKLICEKSIDDDNCFLFLDEKKVYHIFDILLNNAVKFTQKGEIRFGYYFENNYLVGYVFDTGIGIDEKFQDKIFDSFFQVEHSISRKYEGSGVGLSIFRAFVNLMKGEIWLESKLGIGSKFYFKIPIENEIK